MIRHYLKVAFRNLWKYRSQTLISVTGMAVGFACFAMSALWIRYEMTYDTSHKNADRLYRVSVKDMRTPGLTPGIECPLDVYLEKTFPEIKNAARIVSGMTEILEINGVQSEVRGIMMCPSFMKMFDIKILSGNSDFMIFENRQIAITQEKSVQLFGSENPVGKTVKLNSEDYTVGAVVSGYPNSGYSSHNNYPFDILSAFDPNFTIYRAPVLVELHPGVDVKSFNAKLYEHKAVVGFQLRINGKMVDRTMDVEKISLFPLTSIRYSNIGYREIKFQHIIIFAVAGSLLILCTLFNYLALFISRFRIRMRELALRIVCGASNMSLFALLSVEFLMSLLVSLSLGVFLIYLLISPFRELSEVDIELSFIYFESLAYIATVILVSLLTFLLVLYIFRRSSLNVTVRRGNSKMFRRASIVVQLIISIVFAFCTVIILKQMHHIRNSDLGLSLENHGYVEVEQWNFDLNVLETHLKQIPEIEKTVVSSSILRVYGGASPTTYDWDERPQNVEPMHMSTIHLSEKLWDFYEYKLANGEMLSDNDSKEYVLINESAAKIFGWEVPAGKHFTGNYKYFDSGKEHYTVKGVIKNIYLPPFSQSAPPPAMFMHQKWPLITSVVFKYREGTWGTCKEKIERMLKEKYPDMMNYMTVKKEEINFERYLKSENTLLTILTVISIVCIIVCVFGFVSMVSLTCEERRKEIAVRKINGASIKDILDIFFREYLTLLAIGALIAFPSGYVIMKRWLEGYVLQTEISPWIYVSILLVLIMAVVLCVGGKVYKTSRENPVNALNN